MLIFIKEICMSNPKTVGTLLLKVSKSRKQCMVSSILPKNEQKNEKIDLLNSTMIPKVEFFLFVFWENRGRHKLLSRFTHL